MIRYISLYTICDVMNLNDVKSKEIHGRISFQLHCGPRVILVYHRSFHLTTVRDTSQYRWLRLYVTAERLRVRIPMR
jgi:hypothetical protein